MARKQRSVRRGDERTDDAALILRGGTLDPELPRADARRNHEIYGVFAVSVLALLQATLDELAQQPPLVRFGVLTVMTGGAVRSVGLRLEPTGRNPHHFDLAFDDLEPGIGSLTNCDHRSVINPYHQG